MTFSLEELTAHCMEMIGHTREGRSLAHEAVELMVVDEYQAALKKIEEVGDHLSKTHEIQLLKLMSVQVGGEETPCNVLLFHAMDIFMTSTAEKDMIKIVVEAKIKKGKGVRE